MKNGNHYCLMLSLILLFSNCGAKAFGNEKVLSYGEFLKQTKYAKFEQYRKKPGVAVVSGEEFEKMKNHILKLYAGKHATVSFFEDGFVYDCIPFKEQKGWSPAIKPPLPLKFQTPAGDAIKNDSDCKCQSGTFPMPRISLNVVTRFSTLSSFLRK